MRSFVLLDVLCCVTVNALGARFSFPIYVDGKSDPISLYYSEKDLKSSAQMGSLCGNFVKEKAAQFSIASHALKDLKDMATNICKAIAQVYYLTLISFCH
jgi:hypothetical protein